MAPSYLDQELGSQTENRHSARPQPRLCRVLPSATASQVIPPAQSAFSLATPGQQFGFRLPGTGQVSRGHYGFSSRLKRLASASQPGVEAPARTSRVSSATTASLSPDLPADPPEGQLVF